MAASHGPSTVTPNPPCPAPRVSIINSAGWPTMPRSRPGPKACTLFESLPVRHCSRKGRGVIGVPPKQMLNRYSPSWVGVKLTRNPSAVGIMWAFMRLPDGLVMVTAKSAFGRPCVIIRNCCKLFKGAALVLDEWNYDMDLDHDALQTYTFVYSNLGSYPTSTYLAQVRPPWS